MEDLQRSMQEDADTLCIFPIGGTGGWRGVNLIVTFYSKTLTNLDYCYTVLFIKLNLGNSKEIDFKMLILLDEE
uniref:CSON000865 protein n=1 Tax=Culicoides sonorensis TaxID=179676 RepID=A0A336KX94_CULSO